ncbi:MAG TPA: valine--tRNA ligase, partial [Candidatus Acidoferrales bacterium]|nr:valine--tRNA ligase [Candidatus Acidoferrales bacterium]
LSDLEVDHKDSNDSLWYIRYPLADGSGSLTIATTRPETMLGDTAVAVNPDDERYQDYVGKKIRLPLVGREIPIIADAAIDREFGTGALKVTPGHDPVDFELGKRHGLEQISILDGTAHINENGGAYRGLSREEARKQVVKDLEMAGLLEKIEPYRHSVGVCSRCDTIVEPMLSEQWFLRMREMADRAIKAVKDGDTTFYPKSWEKTFFNWLENIHDWCISRQLWWGHRIPAYRCVRCDHLIVAAERPSRCPECDGSDIVQDDDVLDTWFSSGLWPFSTLGWPEDTEDLRKFYPTSLMISGYDILFFWDARMIILGLHLTAGASIEQRVPFRSLYVHGMVRDPHGVKMSKTRGNVIDPLEIIEKYGTDALRFTLAIGAAPGTDIALSEDRILGYRAFANKIWNAARFLFVNLEKIEAAGATLDDLAAPDLRAAAPHRRGGGELPLVERWMYSRLARVAGEVNEALEEFRFHEAAHVVYHFFWHEFCDWYIEWVKPRLAGAEREDAVAAWRNLFAVFDSALRLLHPFMPFLTDELWRRMPQRSGARSIALERFPAPPSQWIDPLAEQQMALLQAVIEAGRQLRSDQKIDPKQKVEADFTASDAGVRALVETCLGPITRLAGFSALRFHDGGLDPAGGALRSSPQFDLRLGQSPADRQAETDRVSRQLGRLEQDLASKQERLADDAFRTRAPAHVVARLETAIQERRAECEKLRVRLAQLRGPDGPSRGG